MILVALALACVVAVVARGGRLAQLAALRVRWTGVALAALALQVLIISVRPAGAPGQHAAAHLASYALAGAFIAVNRRVPGLVVLAAGAALNAAAIAANHGTMPASARAMAIAGLTPGHGFANSAAVAHPHLLALGDVIPVPGPWPLGNVLSVGDLLIVAGLFLVLDRASAHGGRRDRDRVAAAQAALAQRAPGVEVER